MSRDFRHQFRIEKMGGIFAVMLTVFLCLPDAFYYLKDPPPGFLPRFGTITMAGLLGMFLARKGNLVPSHYSTNTLGLLGMIILSSVDLSID